MIGGKRVGQLIDLDGLVAIGPEGAGQVTSRVR